jgi:hypothetical protein
VSISEARWYTEVPPVAPVVGGVTAVARTVAHAGHDLLGAEYLTDACAEGGEWADMCAFDPTIGQCVPPPPLSTGATAGTPGAWTPAPPASTVPTLQNIVSGQVVVTPNPATPWPAGSYIVTADGVEGYWDGTKWVQGRAPTPPAITTVTPNTMPTGAVAQTLTVVGTGFVANSTVRVAGGAALATTFVSATQLTAQFTPGATAATYQIIVRNPGPLDSNQVPITVTLAVAATHAKSGAPGVWFPDGSVGPTSVANLIAGVPNVIVALTSTGAASGVTPWATGQYIQTGTAGAAGQATWNGTAWVAGVGAFFDPANYTINEVKDHVNGLPDNAERIGKIQAILDMERAGKNRGGLVNWLEEQLPYDPTDHTIDEVKERVEGLPHNADRTPEIQRILDLERANKNRTTLVTWLDEQLGVV